MNNHNTGRLSLILEFRITLPLLTADPMPKEERLKFLFNDNDDLFVLRIVICLY